MSELPDKALLRPDEVAEYFSVSTRTVYRWIECGTLGAVKVGGDCIRIPRESVEKSLKPAID